MIAASVPCALLEPNSITCLPSAARTILLAFVAIRDTLAEVLNETEISLAATDCTGRKEAECPHASTCPTLPVWRALDETVTNFLSGYTLVDLMPK